MLPLHLLILMLLLNGTILPLNLLRLLTPHDINALNHMNTIFYMRVVPNINRHARRQTSTNNPNSNRLRHITSGTRGTRRVVRHLLTLNSNLLLLVKVMTMRNIRPTRVILVTTVILLMNDVMNTTLPIRLAMVIQRLHIVLHLYILLLHIRLISPNRSVITLAIMNIRHRPMRKQRNIIRHTRLLLMHLLNHANHVTKTMTTNRNHDLYNNIHTNITNILNMLPNVLTMRQVLYVTMLRTIPLRRLTSRIFSTSLVNTLVLTQPILLPISRIHYYINSTLTKNMRHVYRYVLRLFTTIRSHHTMKKLSCEPNDRVFRRLLFFLFLNTRGFSFLAKYYSSKHTTTPACFPHPSYETRVMVTPTSNVDDYK